MKACIQQFENTLTHITATASLLSEAGHCQTEAWNRLSLISNQMFEKEADLADLEDNLAIVLSDLDKAYRATLVVDQLINAINEEAPSHD